VNRKSEGLKLKNFKFTGMRIIDTNLCNDEEAMANKFWEQNGDSDKNHDGDEIWVMENGN
jgi:hypothetical protein